MANDNILSWNFANWVTVVLMAATLFFAFGIGQKYVSGKVNGGS